ncbi:uncharacterized protein LOC126284063 isoform X2 [Schistocerca gregaria]|nr:uncharacterized protein LOC126284063 isoform X2 [Schistocerca gregaria]
MVHVMYMESTVNSCHQFSSESDCPMTALHSCKFWVLQLCLQFVFTTKNRFQKNGMAKECYERAEHVAWQDNETWTVLYFPLTRIQCASNIAC